MCLLVCLTVGLSVILYVLRNPGGHNCFRPMSPIPTLQKSLVNAPAALESLQYNDVEGITVPELQCAATGYDFYRLQISGRVPLPLSVPKAEQLVQNEMDRWLSSAGVRNEVKNKDKSNILET